MEKKNLNLIIHYKKWRKENPDTWILHAIAQRDMKAAISVSVFSINNTGKRNPHQRRLKKQTLEELETNLLLRIDDISSTKKFSQLLQIIEECKVKGIGALTCYDVANRIGNRLKLQPEVVYLHAGTKKGIENLLGNKIKQRSIKKNELPEPFKSYGLSCHEIEDILCIYKDKFKTSP